MHHLSVLIDQLKSHAEDGFSLRTQKGPFLVKPILKDGYIIGVDVGNLGDAYPFIPIEVFVVVISLLDLAPDNFAINGNVMKKSIRLGDPELPLNSIEGHVAKIVYGRQVGESVFRRITPISKILKWAGVCKIERGRRGGVQGGLRLCA